MQLIILQRGLYPNTHPRKVGQFEHVAKHGGYIYQGREFGVEDFNRLSISREWERLIEAHGTKLSVRVVLGRTKNDRQDQDCRWTERKECLPL